MKIIILTLIFVSILVGIQAAFIASEEDPHQEYPAQSETEALNGGPFVSPWLNTNWNELGKKRIDDNMLKFKKKFSTKKAKNVILFLGDGMGLQTVAAARVYRAQQEGLLREKIYLSWENFPWSGLSRTYTVDRITPDSAATGTAYLTGVKVNIATLGVNENVKYGVCANIQGNELSSILHKSIKEGKATGFVTTTKVTNASPSATYASTASRFWESEVPVGQAPCVDIASQLIESARNQDIRVIFGGGSDVFLPNSMLIAGNDTYGKRIDGKDLIQTWKNKKIAMPASYQYLKTKQDLANLNVATTEYALGLFSHTHLVYDLDRLSTDQPSLQDMTAKAIEMLRKDEDGYFLFVEGGRIDHAHHYNLGKQAMGETLAFDRAVVKALLMTDPEETLIVVTSDHSHTFTVGGYSTFTADILGFTDGEPFFTSVDGKPMLQMTYGNGPGALFHRFEEQGNVTVPAPRKNMTTLGDQIYENTFQQDAAVLTKIESHGAEDVGIYAYGPWAHLFQATEEQSYIAHVMMFASCVGQYSGQDHCPKAMSSSPHLYPTYLASTFSIIVVLWASFNGEI